METDRSRRTQGRAARLFYAWVSASRREPRIAHSDRFPNRVRENQRVTATRLELFTPYQERGVNNRQVCAVRYNEYLLALVPLARMSGEPRGSRAKNGDNKPSALRPTADPGALCGVPRLACPGEGIGDF